MEFYFYRIISLLLILAALNSCEETISDTELPYKEKLVVMCILENGKPLTKFEITRTLPSLHDDSWQNQGDDIITDVTGTISDANGTYPITYNESASYRAEGLIPEAGGTYRLDLKWKGNRVWAVTTVPPPIDIDSITVRKVADQWDKYDSLNILVAHFKPKNSSVYIGYIYDTTSNSKYYGSKVIKYNQVSVSDYASVIVGEDFWYYNVYEQKFPFYVEAWDLPFYDYWKTRYNGDSNDGIFSTSGVNIRWNIDGDGLGLFIGKSETKGYYKD